MLPESICTSNCQNLNKIVGTVYRFPIRIMDNNNKNNKKNSVAIGTSLAVGPKN
jgi:hypothetical protein